jgi:hypothetical protein
VVAGFDLTDIVSELFLPLLAKKPSGAAHLGDRRRLNAICF